jgi:peptide deformylase
MKPILTVPHPILLRPAKPVPRDTDCSKLIAEMFEAMYANNGMGLAAPQIGEPLRIIVGHSKSEGWKWTLINPTIKRARGRMKSREEGCLSVAGSIAETIKVKRWSHISVRGFDENWEQVTVSGSYWQAACLQHEFDHIEGLTIARFAIDE